MQTIHKYGLGTKNNVPVEVDMPHDAHVLHIDWDPNTQQVCVWAIVLDELPTNQTRTFYVAGTGKNLQYQLVDDKVLDHYSTFKIDTQFMTGWFHAFEVCEPPLQDEPEK